MAVRRRIMKDGENRDSISHKNFEKCEVEQNATRDAGGILRRKDITRKPSWLS